MLDDNTFQNFAEKYVKEAEFIESMRGGGLTQPTKILMMKYLLVWY